MMIESLFSELPTPQNNGKLELNVNCLGHGHGSQDVKEIIEIDEITEIIDVNTAVINIVADAVDVDRKSCHNVLDVTILPENISSYSQCLYFTSARSTRLGLLRGAAIWRAIRLLGGWIMVFLFVFGLSFILTASSFPDNPIKFLLPRKKEKKQ